MQLVTHQMQTYPRDVDEDVAMSALRISMLASNKACIIAAPSEKENQFWSQFVHIAEVNETLTVFESLQKNVKACQLNTYDKFKAKMNPAQVLQDSGFLDVFKPW